MYIDLIAAAQPLVATVGDVAVVYKESIFDVVENLAADTESAVKAVAAAIVLIALLIGWWTNGRTIGGFLAAFFVGALVIWGINNIDWGKDTIDETVTSSENG